MARNLTRYSQYMASTATAQVGDRQVLLATSEALLAAGAFVGLRIAAVWNSPSDCALLLLSGIYTCMRSRKHSVPVYRRLCCNHCKKYQIDASDDGLVQTHISASTTFIVLPNSIRFRSTGQDIKK